jgi:hypothetical protein
VPALSAPNPFSYCILRLVPSVERGERLNLGVVLFCRQRRFLGLCLNLDREWMAAFAGERWPGDAAVLEHLAGLLKVVEGDAGAGPISGMDASDRFGWLAAPSSTIVQPSEVHSGLTEDPAATLAALYRRLVSSEREPQLSTGR